MDEGWGESCTGYITVESETPIRIVDSVTTIDDMIEACEDEYVSNEDHHAEKLNRLMVYKEKHG